MKKTISISLTDRYFSSLKELGKNLDKKELLIPYVLTCAATLEYLLNDPIAAFALNNYDYQDALEIAESLYSLPLRRKLISVPSLITGGRLVINRQSATYAKLCELIKSRNILVHNKPQIGSFEFEEDDAGGMSFKFPKKFFENHPVTMSEAKCKRYRQALLEFTKQIHSGDPARNFNPDEIQSSDLLKNASTTK